MYIKHKGANLIVWGVMIPMTPPGSAIATITCSIGTSSYF